MRDDESSLQALSIHSAHEHRLNGHDVDIVELKTSLALLVQTNGDMIKSLHTAVIFMGISCGGFFLVSIVKIVSGL